MNSEFLLSQDGKSYGTLKINTSKTSYTRANVYTDLNSNKVASFIRSNNIQSTITVSPDNVSKILEGYGGSGGTYVYVDDFTSGNRICFAMLTKVKYLSYYLELQ